MFFQLISLNLIQETPKRVLLQKLMTQMKCCISSESTMIFRQKNTIYFLIYYNLTSLDMYNGLSQAYCILNQKEESISIYKGLKKLY